MDLGQLAYFVAVAEEGGFTRAAAREHVAQPGVSAQIRKLESELGQPLFERGRDGARLTAAGGAALPFARAALAGAAGLRSAVDELAGLVRGRVAIGTAPSVGGWLTDALASFNADHPGVEITLIEDTAARLLDGVRSGELDLALAGASRPLPGDFLSETVSDQRLVGAVAEHHRLAGRRSIGLKALAAEPLIALPRGTGGRTALEDAASALGLAPRIAFEAGDPRVLMDLAERGLGVAIVPESAPEHLHAIRITPEVRSRLELVWRAGAASSPAARELIAHARRSLGSDPPTRGTHAE